MSWAVRAGARARRIVAAAKQRLYLRERAAFTQRSGVIGIAGSAVEVLN
jgi:hypothetical protein